MRNFSLYYCPFPEGIQANGISMTDETGQRYIIAIRDTIPEEKKLDTLKHELAHCHLNHFAGARDNEIQSMDFQRMEREADIYASLMPDREFKFLMSFKDKETVLE